MSSATADFFDSVQCPVFIEDDDDADLTILSKAANYCHRDLTKHFATFVDEHGSVFPVHRSSNLDEGKSGGGGGGEEHSLEFTRVHNLYMAQFEGILEEFLMEEGCDAEAFSVECEQALSGQFCALFEEHVNKWFVDAILATCDYTTFHRMMVDEQTRRGARAAVEAHEASAPVAAGGGGDEGKREPPSGK